MIDPRNLRALGQPWCIYHNLTGNAQNVSLLVPRDSVRLPTGIAGGQKRLEADRIIVLGFFYDFVAADGNGFDLIQRDYTASPAGSGTNIVLHAARATTAITRVALCVPETFMPLTYGTASPTLRNPADLVVTTTATGPTSGRLVVWGVLTSSEEDWVPNHNLFGSPFDAGATPPY